MDKPIIKHKNKNSVFICQISEDTFKVIKCLFKNNSQREFIALEAQALPLQAESKQLTESLMQIFKKLEYHNNPIIVSLPRSKAASRYIKIPTQIPDEIDKIVSLQAARYLPYPADELITGYQVISGDKEGYSHVNLIIAHKDTIQYYLNMIEALNCKKFMIVLSSFGLTNLSVYRQPQDSGVALIMDADNNHAELAITCHKKLLFSRYFKFNRSESNWQDVVISELNKTQNAYIEEVSTEKPAQILLCGAAKPVAEFQEILNKQMSLPVKILSYSDKVNMAGDFLKDISNSNHSFASLIGLGLEDIEESLNLLPQNIKAGMRKAVSRRGRLRLVLFILSIILIIGLGIAKNLDNKAKYLKQLKDEVNKVAQVAKPFEEIENRLKAIQSRAQAKRSVLDLVYELHQAMPIQVSLTSFSYEEANQVILRGETPDLNSVFNFIAQLEKSTAFKNFKIKVRYATQKKTASGEIIDFEILCLAK